MTALPRHIFGSQLKRLSSLRWLDGMRNFRKPPSSAPPTPSTLPVRLSTVLPRFIPTIATSSPPLRFLD